MSASAFVLDTSVTAAWLLPDEASEHTQRLYARIRRDEVDPHAPNVWQWECSNLIASGVNSSRIPQASVEGMWGVLEAIRHRVELHDLAPAQHKAVLDVALLTALPTYDAAYLWLAQSLRLPLATFDAAQIAAAHKSGVQILAAEDF
ncbi:type II toxin-antitoxin system VapC family toxin [Comamonas sp. Y33R10-2]|uniref:type II toxin-antitoxin system VapC family toxin n=1 Tax=Comamonas sp. Y33R10-2 TaxID=2853257 RepID=UPI001C5C9FB5|nr:type II toxin-antitoxin system VapC family toxin [Comamonas sp. Y33R10-2]QXZ10785.1 type II toxin-antitoxin system VapC family toxin [Comamonas sp. Y33R10-2]